LLSVANKKNKNNKNFQAEQKTRRYVLSDRLKGHIVAVIIVLVGVIILLAFFKKAGVLGNLIVKGLYFLIGDTAFFIPFLFFLGAALLIKPLKEKVLMPLLYALSALIISISGLFSCFSLSPEKGGWAGYIISWPFFHYLSPFVAKIIFFALIIISLLILWEFSPSGFRGLFAFFAKKSNKGKEKEEQAEQTKKESTLSNIEIKPVEPLQITKIPIKNGTKKESMPSSWKSDFIEEGKKTRYQKPFRIDSKYKPPPIELLDQKEEVPTSGDTEYNALVIKRTLKNFGINVEMSEVNIGPTVTQYTLKPAEGIKLSKITSLANDLALSLASHPIRIEAPIPGRSLVGIEVPNKIRAKVKTGNLLALPEFKKNPSPLVLAIGKDVMGKPFFADLAKMPHLLVAGATGAGKTIALNSIILSLIYRNSPKTLRLILIDPKRVEFSIYASLPHLLTPVILDVNKAINAINWLIGEMERRFEILREAGARDILSFNRMLFEKKKMGEKGFETMPYIALIIDELADLMMAKGREVENSIVRLSQLARAVGIHLILTTQRPSVEVITGLIKANITSRIAFQVASQVDSRTILDLAGAEKLLGRGDMLFISSEFSRPKRIQGAFVSSAEIKKVVNFLKKEDGLENGDELSERLERDLQKPQPEKEAELSGDDNLYGKAREIVIEYQKASASLLQRRLKIGYARAARILDMLEENGVIGPADGAKPRKVYVKSEDDSELF